jgi:hypothetical protein
MAWTKKHNNFAVAMFSRTDGMCDAINSASSQGVVHAMKKLLSGLVLLHVLALGGVTQVHADAGNPLLTQDEFMSRAHRAEALSERVKRVQTYSAKINKLQMSNGTWERRGPAVSIPELDANAAGAALALLLGGSYMLIERKKRLAL